MGLTLFNPVHGSRLGSAEEEVKNPEYFRGQGLRIKNFFLCRGDPMWSPVCDKGSHAGLPLQGEKHFLVVLMRLPWRGFHAPGRSQLVKSPSVHPQ